MSRIGKSDKYRLITELPNVMEVPVTFPPPFTVSQKYNPGVFPVEQDLVLELGCGKGEYTLGLASHFKEKNFIGIDIKGARIHDGAIAASKAELKNVFFIRTYIECLDLFFPQNSVSEIWLPFPDPFPARSRRRLTSSVFLERYKGFLKPGALIHLKTDSSDLYHFTLDTLQQNEDYKMIRHTPDLYKEAESLPVEVQTFFEKKFLQKNIPIKYCLFQYRGETEQ